jgi:hypothetical protein
VSSIKTLSGHEGSKGRRETTEFDVEEEEEKEEKEEEGGDEDVEEEGGGEEVEDSTELSIEI